MGENPSEPAKLGCLDFNPGRTRGNVDQLNIEDILQLDSVSMIKSTIVHTAIEENLEDVQRAKNLKDRLECGAWKVDNIDHVSSDRRRGGSPESDEGV